MMASEGGENRTAPGPTGDGEGGEEDGVEGLTGDGEGSGVGGGGGPDW